MIEGLTIATYNTEAMVNFYAKVFGLAFESKQMYGTTLYNAEWSGLKLQFCPAQLAGIEAEQNRHQFDIVVDDLDKALVQVTVHGGSIMHDIQDSETSRTVGIYDPDKNSIVLIEKK